jgi:hypothetical protein
VVVTEGTAAGGGAELDLLTAALRVLEEHGDDMPLQDLAAELGVSLDDIHTVLTDTNLLTIEPDDETALHDLVLEEFDDDDIGIPLTAMRARVERNMRGLPLRRRGLDALGLFAYTATETAERLRLIDSTLGRGQAVDEEALMSAKR